MVTIKRSTVKILSCSLIALIFGIGIGRSIGPPVVDKPKKSHSHEWELVNESHVFDANRPDAKYPMGKKWTYQCKGCFDIMTKDNFSGKQTLPKK